MRRVNALTREEINRALEDIDNQLAFLRGRSGYIPIQGDIDLGGHVVSNSGQASRNQDLITKGAVDTLIETTNTTIINQAGASAWLRVNEQLTGTADGSNTVFEFPRDVLSGNKVALFDNYVRLRRVLGTPSAMEYALVGRVATLGSAPSSGARVSADYLTPRPASPIFDEVPTGTKNGVNMTFTLEYEPSAESDVSVFSNGILTNQVNAAPLPPDEYTITGQTITTGWAPAATDDLKVDYPVKEPGAIYWNDDLYGDKNSVNTTFTLDDEPLGERVAIYRSHVRLTRVASAPSGSLEYSLTKKTVTLGSAPSSDEPLYANYQVPAGGEVLHSGPGLQSVGSEVLDVIVTTAVDFEFVTGREPATLDHGDLSGLADDDHTQYALLAGRSGGQTLIGGTDSGNDLTLKSTSHATKGDIFFGGVGLSRYDEVNDLLRIHRVTNSATAGCLILGNQTTSAPPQGDFIQFQFLDSDSVAGNAAYIGAVLTARGSASLTADLSFYVRTAGVLSITEAMRLSAFGNLTITSNTGLAKELITLDQNDTDQAFFDFQGNTGADATASISTRTVATINGYVQIEINGTKKWIAYYNDPTA